MTIAALIDGSNAMLLDGSGRALTDEQIIAAAGAASGVGAATAVGTAAGFTAAIGSAAGVGAASAGGTVAPVGLASGVGSATAVGAVAAGDSVTRGSAAGVGAATAVGAKTAAAGGSGTGGGNAVGAGHRNWHKRFPGIKSLAPAITSDGGGASAAVSMAEAETDVTTVVATQAHGGGPINYAITGGDDAALFDIIPSTGLLYFLDAPAFDTPLDADTDNVYELEVTATGRGGLSDSQAISVTVEAASAGAVAPGIHYDGTDGSKVLRGDTLTLPSSASTILAAGWLGNAAGPVETGAGGLGFNTGGTSPNQHTIINIAGNGDETSYLFVTLRAADNAIVVDLSIYPLAVDLRTGWHSVAVAANTATQTLQVYVDRVSIDTSGATWNSSDPLSFPSGEQFVMDTASSGSGVSADLSNFLFVIGGTFFDLSDTANLNKLFSTDNKAISWGADGSLVTGSQPHVFMYGDHLTINNLGSAGSFAPVGFALGDGTITDASTSPSD